MCLLYSLRFMFVLSFVVDSGRRMETAAETMYQRIKERHVAKGKMSKERGTCRIQIDSHVVVYACIT